MELAPAIDFARTTQHSVLVTIRRNGRPQLSNVAHNVDSYGLIRISITADRAKYHNLVREPWAALHVTRPDFYAYAVLEGDVELTPVAAPTRRRNGRRARRVLPRRRGRTRRLGRATAWRWSPTGA